MTCPRRVPILAPMTRNYTTERLCVDVLPEMQAGVRVAAERRGISVNAYLRRAIAGALALDGFAVPVATSDEPSTTKIKRESKHPHQVPAVDSMAARLIDAPLIVDAAPVHREIASA